MRRREFITLLGGAATWPIAARAQQPMPTIGFLNNQSADEYAALVLPGLRSGLGELGYIEGRNVVIEYRWANGQNDRVPAMAAELVARKVSVIVATGGVEPTLAAKSATTTIPIVFASGGDPIAIGFVASLNRPGGNVTGVSYLSTALETKRLQLLRDLLPAARSLGVLINPSSPSSNTQLSQVQGAAQAVGQQLHILKANTEPEIETAFETFAHEGASGVLVVATVTFVRQSDKIVALAARHQLPTIYAFREFVTTGGLMSYGPSLFDAHRQAGVYAGRILKGEKPADLPVMQPTKFELVINLKTAKALGLTIPPTLLAIADDVIE